jgi:ubiquitin-like 1-activating enzyme E1 B
VNVPYLLSGTFSYEEGEDLDEDELEFAAANLPKTLANLPGGGLGHGVVLSVMDNSQGGFNVEVIVSHKVGPGPSLEGAREWLARAFLLAC